MKKLLVTTDFSTASRAGVRFAIQLATQMEVEPVFFHCFQALIPSTIHQERIERELQHQGHVWLKKLEQYIAGIHRSMKVRAGKHHVVVVESLDPTGAIMDYAEKHDFQYICMSTRGAGTLRKLIGTHSANVLKKSTVPVIIVPHNYRLHPIKKILYSSDLENLNKEMPIVTAFGDMLNVKTDLVHFYLFGEKSSELKNLPLIWRAKYPQLDCVYIQPYNFDKGFPAQLASLTRKTKPSLVAFFTHTNKTWFEKLFSTSITESLSFEAKEPMLVYRKIGKG